MTAGPVPAHDADPLAAALTYAARGAGRPPGWDDALDASTAPNSSSTRSTNHHHDHQGEHAMTLLACSTALERIGALTVAAACLATLWVLVSVVVTSTQAALHRHHRHPHHRHPRHRPQHRQAGRT